MSETITSARVRELGESGAALHPTIRPAVKLFAIRAILDGRYDDARAALSALSAAAAARGAKP